MTYQIKKLFKTQNPTCSRRKYTKQILDATTLININHKITDKQSLEKKTGDVDKKIPDVSTLVTTTALTAVKNTIPTINIKKYIKYKNI